MIERGDRLHEHADKNQHDIDQQEDDVTVVRDGKHVARDHVRDVLGYKDPGEHIGESDEDEDGAGRDRRFHENGNDPAYRQVAKDDGTDEKGVD